MSTRHNFYGILAFLWLLETAVFASESRAYILPHFSFLFLVHSALVHGPKAGLKGGLFLGFLLDLSGLDSFGLYAMLYGAVGLASGLLKDKIILKSLTTSLLVPTGCYLCVLIITLLITRSEAGSLTWAFFQNALIYSPLIITFIMAPLCFKIFALGKPKDQLRLRQHMRRFPS